MALTDMALTKAEAKEMEQGCVASEEGDSDLPKYPYGLTLWLNDDILAKLGMSTPLPAPGTEMMLSAKVMVTGTSQRETLGGDPDMCLDIQITAMELTAGAPPSMADRAAKLYKDTD
ncbi:hypothetical protein JessAGP_052c [Caulobacter phage Jess A]|nr:hypothetical protein JessAGP_052c [Caulobacter phage Jess A]WCA46462.1 hypothetical protein [Caulobacter phage RapA]